MRTDLRNEFGQKTAEGEYGQRTLEKNELEKRVRLEGWRKGTGEGIMVVEGQGKSPMGRNRQKLKDFTIEVGLS